jgi:hypothetical protein
VIAAGALATSTGLIIVASPALVSVPLLSACGFGAGGIVSGKRVPQLLISTYTSYSTLSSDLEVLTRYSNHSEYRDCCSE